MAEKQAKKPSAVRSKEKTPNSSNLHENSDDRGALDSVSELTGTESTLFEYKTAHNRLLAILLLVAGFIFASFPISDPDIFPSLRVGQMIVSGEFPWGEDPFCYADGEHAPWIHPGWLGDVILYELYSLGGGPLLVLTRAALLVFALALLLNLGNPGPRRFLTILTALLGLLALCPRLYMRTEFFSYLCLALTFWALLRPCHPSSIPPLHRGGLRDWLHRYWLIPPLFLIWANLDDWFFLGPVALLLWFLASFLQSQTNPKEQKPLGIVLVLSLLATLCTPFHVKSYTAIPKLLHPPASSDLATNYAEHLKQNPDQRPAEQLRFFLSPWTKDFFNNPRVDVLHSLASQAPFLPVCYPLGLSLTEWSYYALTMLVLLSLFARGVPLNIGILLAVGLFELFGAWQSRLVGFFAIAGTALAIYQWQNRPMATAPASRMRLMLGQLARMVTALAVQLLCLAMLMPVPDATPSPIGYLHPRGGFGYSFRIDPSLAHATEELQCWSSAGLPGRPFHVDWTDLAQYNPWFNPIGRTFFDRRYEAHSEATTASFLEIHDALLDSARVLLKSQRETPEQRKKRQSVWQKFFERFDISHIVLRERSITRITPEGKTLSVSLIFSLLDDRNEKNEPLWKPLDFHDGHVFVLAWTGSQHWPKLEPWVFDSGTIVFRGKGNRPPIQHTESEPYTLNGFLRGDPPRRPAAIEESRWYQLVGQRQRQADLQKIGSIVITELQGGMLGRLAAQAASPGPQFFLPFLVGESQFASLSSNYLALSAAQRGIAQLAADATVRQRADAWEQLLDALADLSAYEMRLSPASSAFREPLRLYAMRQAAFAYEAANRPHAFLLHLQLAALYRNRHILDTAWEHYQAALRLGERNADFLYKQFQQQTPSQFREKLPEIVKQAFGGSVTEFETLLKNQQQAWEQEVGRKGWLDTNKFAAQRAALALQSGLVNKALGELIAAKSISPEAAALATSICMELGQYDIMLDHYLLPNPGLQSILGDAEYHQRLSLGWWCKGRPQEAAQARQIVADLAETDALRSMTDSGMQLLFGTSTSPRGSMIDGTVEAQRSLAGSFNVANQKIEVGMLLLEAGSPQEAAKIFLAALRDVEPETPWRPLVARYYLQITGRALEADLAAK